MYETFIDLDELIVRCRDKQAKKLIQEAVACYRAGAFRSCIVATWNAVVFDFLHKLRELSLLGNGEASTILEKFDNLRITENVKELWQFESNIPEVALTKFELISSVEKKDIERLFEDRSRCAHPSMTSLEEPFEATAEMARYHLRSAVIHILQRPPVQGRAALTRIWKNIEDENFPLDTESAVIVLQKSPLGRARVSVVESIVIGLTKKLLIDELSEDEQQRHFSALNAVSIMYTKETVEKLNNTLSDIILDKIVNENWDKVIIYLGNTTAWDIISEPCQIKAKNFIDKLDIHDNVKNGRFAIKKNLLFKNIDILVKAAYVDFLRDSVINKLQLSIDELLEIKKRYKDTLLNEKIINPILKDTIHQATLDNLAMMVSDLDTSLYDVVKFRIEDEIKKASFDNLLELLSEYNNEYLHQLIKCSIKDKISATSLQSLISGISDFKSELRKLDKQLIELIENYLLEKIQEMTFDDFDELIKIKDDYRHPIIEQHFKNLIKNNVDGVVDKFVYSGTWASAMSNTHLLVEIVDILKSEHWKRILDAFCTNNQIYGCPYRPPIASTFISLFKKSVENTGIVQTYWLDFRRNLDKFATDKDINQLKLAIDYTQL
ncbi:hypothetical protein H6G74_19005 [Nostoc spongiaeforme FACHB-130]|uniref:Uncharacterized protein n=1 Tax=Nostoc spongiaeforme FACHB-130 TaxID=1357510 RepID=A0ABR8FY95_9NOSO|nr:hypothetical protein [Nostoc spongiaeforme]MBD2596404.1 hypothetical protein [Nostoc spongiaeforme FACHB-130]